PSTTSRDWRRSPERHRVTADARGAFTLDVPVDGDDWEATLLALKPGYGSTGQRLYSPGSTRDLRLILSRSGSIAGRVLDRAGHPAPGAAVSVLWARRPDVADTISFSGAGPSAVSDALGRFRLNSLPEGASAALSVEHPRYAVPRGGSEPVAVGTEDTILTL